MSVPAGGRAVGERARDAPAALCDSRPQVCSSLCHLSGLPAEKLVAHGEEGREVGGYFIINGNERIIRLLVQQRRHYIMGMIRGAYARRGPAFTGASPPAPRAA